MVEAVWSVDDGFGDFKGYNGKKKVIVPNFVTRWQGIPQDDVSGNFQDRESHITDFSDVRKKLVGLGAQLLDKTGFWDGQENKHNSEKNFLAIFRTVLGLLAEEYMEEEIHLNPLVMSLPVEQETAARKKQLLDLVKRTHKVEIELGDGTLIKKTIIVDSVIIKSQPFGTYCYHALDDKGNSKDNSLKDKVSVVFDLGARTLNVLTLRGFAQQTVESGLSYTKMVGMYEAWDTLAQDLKDEMGLNLGIARVKQAASTEEGFGGHGFLTDGTDISEFRDAVYYDHSDRLLSEFERSFIHNKDEVDDILITGGGSAVLREWLEDRKSVV